MNRICGINVTYRDDIASRHKALKNCQSQHFNIKQGWVHYQAYLVRQPVATVKWIKVRMTDCVLLKPVRLVNKR